MWRHPRRPAAALTVGLGAILAASCGSYEDMPTTGASLEGAVTYKNQPVDAGIVSVSAASGGATGAIEGGKYKIDNVPVGELSIGVNTAPAVARARGEQMGKAIAKGEATGKAGKKGGAPLGIVEVPAKYADPAKSGIKTVTKSGTNTYDIAID